MRVAISGSPTAPSRSSFSFLTASSVSRWTSLSTPVGFERKSTGSPCPRKGTPWYAVGRKPLPQLLEPPLVPFCPVEKTTYPGRFCDSLPSPYVTHEPMLGRPNC